MNRLFQRLSPPEREAYEKARQFLHTGNPNTFHDLESPYRSLTSFSGTVVDFPHHVRLFRQYPHSQLALRRAEESPLFVVTQINGKPITYKKFIRHGLYVPPPTTVVRYEINGDAVYLDDAVQFLRQLGERILGFYSQSSRSRLVIAGNEVIEQKGVIFSLPHPRRSHYSTNNPFGLLNLEDAILEHENAAMAGRSLPYVTKVIDMQQEVVYKDLLGNEATCKVGILERRGKLGEFAPNIRLHQFDKDFFRHYGLSIDDVVWNLGHQMGLIHNSGVFPMFPHLGNIDIFGNHVDFENSPNINRMQQTLEGFSNLDNELLKRQNITPLSQETLGQIKYFGRILFEALGLFGLLYERGNYGIQNLANLATSEVVAGLMKRISAGYLSARLNTDKVGEILKGLEFSAYGDTHINQIKAILSQIHGDKANELTEELLSLDPILLHHI